uniref:Lipase n=1 Tax=Globodera rostochiensis TaxID=31243 RepID=A0A914H073_GLORO
MLFLSFLIFLFYIFFSFARVCEAEEQPSASASSLPYTQLKGPITSDFQEWLKKNGYDRLHLAKLVANPQNSYGGRQFEGQTLKNRPVIFIHGNSDGALAQGDEEWSQGWSANIKYFLINGYSSAEMYAITYGNRNLTYAMNRSIDCATVIKMRLFLEAVLQYTGSQYVNIVAHSMGVTIARIIIQGNTFSEAGKVKCHLGKQLMNRVSNLIGIAGANFGMCSCSNETIAQTFAACGKLTGFWTSSRCPDHEMATNTRRCWHVLTENATEKKPDKLLKGEHLTSLIPLSDRSILCDGPSHFALKWATMDDQLAILRQQ